MSWNLATIRAKVRNIAGVPSSDQMLDAEVDAYINNYMVYTMPSELKTQIQNNFLDFKTQVGVDTYALPGAYLTDSPGAYADGFPLIFYEDPDVFYQDWPQQYAVDNLFTGDGTTVAFSGGLQNPPIIIGTCFVTDGVQVLQDTGTPIMTETIDVGDGGTAYNGTLLSFPIVTGSLSITAMSEVFSDNGNSTLSSNLGGTGTINYTTGVWTLNFNTAVATGANIIATYELDTDGVGTLTGNGSGTINYVTGAITVSFTNPPDSTSTIYAKYQGYQGNRPQGVMFFENQFTLRPVPDQVYQIRMQGFILPTLLVKDTDTPSQPEWGPLIAFGAALDIFTDRGEIGSYNENYPVFKRYENVALSRSIQQYTAEQSVPRF